MRPRRCTDMLSLRSTSTAETEQIAQMIATVLPEKAVVFLKGPLGAGKTAFVKGVAKAKGYTKTVHSPTFAFIHEYRGDRAQIAHMDLYRLTGAEGLEELGIEEYLEGPYLCLIEWPEVLEKTEKPDMTIEFTILSEEERRLCLHATAEIEGALQERMSCSC